MKLFTVYSLNQNGHKEVVNHYETSRMAWSTCNFLNKKSKNQAVKESDELKTYCISHNFSMAESWLSQYLERNILFIGIASKTEKNILTFKQEG